MSPGRAVVAPAHGDRPDMSVARGCVRKGVLCTHWANRMQRWVLQLAGLFRVHLCVCSEPLALRIAWLFPGVRAI